MAGFWIYKYSKDEDITLIEYKKFKDPDSLTLPAMSICFIEPFIISNRSDLSNDTFNSEAYLKYLQGDKDLFPSYKNMSYDDITLDILDYLDQITVLQKLEEGQNQSITTCSNAKACPYVVFENNYSGFFNTSFSKCFEMKITEHYSKNVEYVGLNFKTIFHNLMGHVSGVWIRFSYPGQLLRDPRSDQLIWRNLTGATKLVGFKIDYIEVLQRRNKKNKPCLSNSNLYDKVMEEKMIEIAGCRAPHHKFKTNFSLCNNLKQLAVFDEWNLIDVKIPPPCDEMSYISFKYLENEVAGEQGLYPLMIAYPKDMKVVMQQQAIDIHALVGNIGGYIGLFLGIK